MRKGVVIRSAVIKRLAKRKMKISRLRGLELSAVKGSTHLLDLCILRILITLGSCHIEPGLAKKRFTLGQILQKLLRFGLLPQRRQHLCKIVLNLHVIRKRLSEFAIKILRGFKIPRLVGQLCALDLDLDRIGMMALRFITGITRLLDAIPCPQCPTERLP